MVREHTWCACRYLHCVKVCFATRTWSVVGNIPRTLEGSVCSAAGRVLLSARRFSPAGWCWDSGLLQSFGCSECEACLHPPEKGMPTLSAEAVKEPIFPVSPVRLEACFQVHAGSRPPSLPPGEPTFCPHVRPLSTPVLLLPPLKSALFDASGTTLFDFLLVCFHVVRSPSFHFGTECGILFDVNCLWIMHSWVKLSHPFQ